MIVGRGHHAGWRLLLPLALLAACGAMAAPLGEPSVSPAANFDEAFGQAQRLMGLGDRRRAIDTLLGVKAGVERDGTARAQVMEWSLLGRAYLQAGQLEPATPLLRQAEDLARTAPAPDLLPGILDDQGLLHAARHDYDSALGDYAAAAAAAKAAAAPAPQVSALLNAADIHLMRQDFQDTDGELHEVAAALSPQPASQAKDLLALGLASRSLELYRKSGSKPALQTARSTLAGVLDDAAALSDRRGLAEALGEMGEVERASGSPERAVEDMRGAIFAAQAAAAPDLLYWWEWQAGRLLAAQGQWPEAITLYRQAIATLQPLRSDLLQESRGANSSYRDTIGPLFLEFADVLTRQSGATQDAAASRDNLLEAREAMEQLKTVELEDYFQDGCVAQFRARQRDIEQLPRGTAVLYPIILPDRLELLLSVGDDIRRHTVPVTGKALSAEAVVFRKKVVKRTTREYLPDAQQLYAWLIEPVLPELKTAEVDTLVVVPDGALLGIPFAALHDGQDFLVQHFAVATIPGLHLIEPGRQGVFASRALLSGISTSVQGFPALPSVDDELRGLSKLLDAQLLDNERFTVPTVEHAVDRNQYSVVHIASHGKFDSVASKSYLLTYDGKMDMDALARVVKAGRSRGEPVDILTLSACETAVGDDRAALGLAGVALKAGARSVLASLWFVNDEATSTMITGFYRELERDGRSKAKALQAAQLSLLGDERYRHPGYWAPFLIIGNWN
jgi:CHAT domain-containing protein